MLCPLIVIFFVQSIEWTRSQKTLSLQTGASVTVPCHYDLKYIQHKKYWCYDASSAYNYCRILAYANTTQEKVTVSDNPAQSLFTVSMRDLQKENSGAYWCAVEIGGRYEPDVIEQLYLRVDSDPAVSVLESRVSGAEGSSVSVQCLYSAAYKKEVKKWCRSIDWTCYTVGRTNTSQNSAVQISDGGEGSFMVLMTGLKQTDAGWYWCSAGYLQVPVHLIISGSATRRWITAVTLAVLVGLTLLAGVAVWTCRKRHKATERNQSKSKERTADREHCDAEMDLAYSSVIFSGSKKQLGRSDPEKQKSEDPVTYSTLTDVKQNLE
ncbi:polymeric immunoglobulin receptor-like isoform X2 [Electrophorus electricus]|uniref:Ig-like domain-containing protein n=1 Tax=Electrophorus electricus TaxID=8005 RepID=A0AAY5F375_ELEEL|nr:polymeric immunoglobulin receptor-like isoform X2 [Electrophorus electricus]